MVEQRFESKPTADSLQAGVQIPELGACMGLSFGTEGCWRVQHYSTDRMLIPDPMSADRTFSSDGDVG